jgi:hypothetical protein
MTQPGKITLLVSAIFKQVPQNYRNKSAFYGDWTFHGRFEAVKWSPVVKPRRMWKDTKKLSP